MIYIIAGLVIAIAVQMVLLVQFSIQVNYLRERLLKQIRVNHALAGKIAEARQRRANAERELTEIGKIYRERTMPVEMTEVKHD